MMRAPTPTSRRVAACAVLAIAAWLVPAVAGGGHAMAATYRVDETGTVVSQPVVNMRWRHYVPGRRADNTMEAAVRVDLRLNLQPWLNRPSRIYMVMAPVSTGTVSARWTTQGRLLPGRVTSGERALVFDGPAGPASLSESLVLLLEADGERVQDFQMLDFHFEIEVTP
jgi:hypothetical protein